MSCEIIFVWRRNVPIRADMKNIPKKLDHKASGFGVLRGRAHERNGRSGIVEREKRGG